MYTSLNYLDNLLSIIANKLFSLFLKKIVNRKIVQAIKKRYINLEKFDVIGIIAKAMLRAGYEVYHHEKNNLDLPIFHAQGVGNSKFDLLTIDPTFKKELFNPTYVPTRVNRIRAAGIETKQGEHWSQLLEGTQQIAQYYKQFVSGKMKIFVEGDQVYNMDAILLATRWSPLGMLYRGDEYFHSITLNYLSENYNVRFFPYTQAIHSFCRVWQNVARQSLRRELKFPISANKTNIQTGVMFCKEPLYGNVISEDYYAWMGNTFLPILAKSKQREEKIEVLLKIHYMSDGAYLCETSINKQGYIPKSVIDIPNKIEFKKWIKVKILRWFYRKNRDLFGFS